MFERADEIMPVDTILSAIEKIESAKFAAILERVRARPRQLGMIYSQFVGLGGLSALARFLDQNGYEGRYAMITGAIPPDDRSAIIDRFCASGNAHAELIDLLLVSSTGAEGIDLKNVRHVHILEPYWNFGRIKQVRARAIRNQSHVELPLEERDVITFIYVAVAPAPRESADADEADAGAKARERAPVIDLTSDEELYENARRGQLMISAFETAIKEVAIECAINHRRADRPTFCRMCAPTDEPLFTDAIESDMRMTDPCHPAKSRSISGIQKIKVGSVEYAYKTAVPGSVEERVYGYDVFVEDERIHAWRKIALNDARYDAIVAAITNEQGTGR